MVIEVTEASAVTEQNEEIAEIAETATETLDAAALDHRSTEVLAASMSKIHTPPVVIIEKGSAKTATGIAVMSASGTGIGSHDETMATGHRGENDLREGNEISLRTGGVEVEEAVVEEDAANVMALEGRPVGEGTGRRAQLRHPNRRNLHQI
ncbi:MAG: hypothetical protein ACRYG8_15020 [Janthinobacterium lividum]